MFGGCRGAGFVIGKGLCLGLGVGRGVDVCPDGSGIVAVAVVVTRVGSFSSN